MHHVLTVILLQNCSFGIKKQSLTQMNHYTEQVTLWWDDHDDACFVLDQHTELDLISATSLEKCCMLAIIVSCLILPVIEPTIINTHGLQANHIQRHFFAHTCIMFYVHFVSFKVRKMGQWILMERYRLHHLTWKRNLKKVTLINRGCTSMTTNKFVY